MKFGKGNLKSLDDSYDGDIKNDFKHGNGKIAYKNGDSYEG